MGELTYSNPSISLDGMRLSSYSMAEAPSAKSLRKQAKAVEKRERKAKAAAKARKANRKRTDQDRAAVREALLRVVNDESKGYASVQAAEAMRELGFI